ncbi:hypothetical protein [Aporhodopirellula aestuarii]|uniref:Uncharacterized protein n=1 Tax=Aporhodopirellula aestuarii TaxID=2950107 RepID=A0ABT0TZS9_9BACT|nr:hypothetical protein [Aporhodopirellula aestuarii]MCM2369894.1 hypothetical protein [Aporhodopirellula aestuarii]
MTTNQSETFDENSAEAMTVIEEAYLEYRDAGLRLPPIPKEFVETLDEFADWYWGTDEMSLDNVTAFLESAMQPGGESGLAFGITGHGINSLWLCYRLKLKTLAVYTRFAFGGAYQDNDAAIPRVNEATTLLEELIPAAQAANEAGRFRGGHRMVVIDDQLSERSWQIAGGPVDKNVTDNPIREALTYLGEAFLNE